MRNFGLIRKSGLFIFFFVVSGFLAFSQVTSPLSSGVRYTSYPGEPEKKDPIFIFCVPEGNNDFSVGELVATPPGGIAGWTFNWSKYNPLDSVFESSFQIDTCVSSSTVTGLESGGYKVRIRDACSMDTSFVVWVFNDRPYSSITIEHYNCWRVKLKGLIGAPFSYYDTTDNSAILLGNGVSFHWWSDPESSIPFPDIEINPLISHPYTPFEDTWYYLTVTDSFGCSNEASLFYESIHVKADFEPDPTEGEAPLEVSFTNNSLNAVEYEWRFGDDTISILETPEPHTYYNPKIEYEVVLIARSEEHCVDTFKFQYIKVDPSSLDIPNVFTPNGDSYNDKFIISGKSLQSIYVQIFNRLGKRIYEYTGHGAAIKDWEGWDGKINGRSDASPGMYYYIIRAVGYDDISYKGKEYTGVLYLFREK